MESTKHTESATKQNLSPNKVQQADKTNHNHDSSQTKPQQTSSFALNIDKLFSDITKILRTSWKPLGITVFFSQLLGMVLAYALLLGLFFSIFSLPNINTIGHLFTNLSIVPAILLIGSVLDSILYIIQFLVLKDPSKNFKYYLTSALKLLPKFILLGFIIFFTVPSGLLLLGIGIIIPIYLLQLAPFVLIIDNKNIWQSLYTSFKITTSHFLELLIIDLALSTISKIAVDLTFDLKSQLHLGFIGIASGILINLLIAITLYATYKQLSSIYYAKQKEQTVPTWFKVLILGAIGVSVLMLSTIGTLAHRVLNSLDINETQLKNTQIEQILDKAKSYKQ